MHVFPIGRQLIQFNQAFAPEQSFCNSEELPASERRLIVKRAALREWGST